MSKHASPAMVGGFIVVAAAILVAAVFVIGGGKMFHEKARVIVFFDGSVAGLRKGAAVKFRGIDIGTVKDIRINMTGAMMDPRHVRIPVLLEIDKDTLKAEGVEAIHLDSHTQVKELVVMGLRAELATESLVTGVLYVALDVRPDTPIRLSGGTKYPEIPSLPSMREAIPGKIEDILAKVSRLDLDKLTTSLQSTLDHADKLLGSPELEQSIARLDGITQRANKLLGDLDGAAQHLTPTLAELGQTASSARKVLVPAGVLTLQLDATLRDIQTAARSLRRLADHLNRDPGAVLRGGKS